MLFYTYFQEMEFATKKKTTIYIYESHSIIRVYFNLYHEHITVSNSYWKKLPYIYESHSIIRGIRQYLKALWH
jgi:hypothetical protein